MGAFISLVSSPEFIAVLVGFMVMLRAIGEFFMYLGRVIPGKDFAETLSGKIAKACDFIGRIFAWLGIGNNTK